MIRRYQNDVFTNHGTCTVEEFEEKLAKAEDDLRQIDGLVVYVGYHGDNNGNWKKEFNNTEKSQVMDMTAAYPNHPYIQWCEIPLEDQEIVTALNRGRVLFSWCNSDTKVLNVMRTNRRTLTHVKDYP